MLQILVASIITLSITVIKQMKVFRKKKHTGVRGYLVFLNGATSFFTISLLAFSCTEVVVCSSFSRHRYVLLSDMVSFFWGHIPYLVHKPICVQWMSSFYLFQVFTA